jgi:hypothetical protein
MRRESDPLGGPLPKLCVTLQPAVSALAFPRPFSDHAAPAE